MKKTLITLALVLTLSASALLVSCGGNTATGGNAGNNGTTANGTEQTTETDKNIVGDAESMIEDGIEDATHGIQDGTPGGDSARNHGHRDHMIPRGK